MKEANHILKSATDKSLVLIDELGRRYGDDCVRTLLHSITRKIRVDMRFDFGSVSFWVCLSIGIWDDN